jgi:hypothetical protein
MTASTEKPGSVRSSDRPHERDVPCRDNASEAPDSPRAGELRRRDLLVRQGSSGPARSRPARSRAGKGRHGVLAPPRSSAVAGSSARVRPGARRAVRPI